MISRRLLSAVFFPQNTVNIPVNLLHFFDLIFERIILAGELFLLDVQLVVLCHGVILLCVHKQFLTVDSMHPIRRSHLHSFLLIEQAHRFPGGLAGFVSCLPLWGRCRSQRL